MSKKTKERERAKTRKERMTHKRCKEKNKQEKTKIMKEYYGREEEAN